MARRDSFLSSKLSSDIISEFSALAAQLTSLSPIAGVIGSARIPPEKPVYGVGRAIGEKLSAMGYTVMTGSGSGLMTAANEGASKGPGLSVGLAVTLFDDETANPFLDHCFRLDQVELRKQAFTDCCEVVVGLPGGFGTLDELSDILVANQYRKPRRQIILVDHAFWRPALDWFRDRMLRDNLIDPIDLDLPLVDDVLQFVDCLASCRKRAM